MTTIHIEVVAAYANHVEQHRLELASGSTLADAVAAVVALETPDAAALVATARAVTDEDLGIWGRRALPSTVLADGDRIELYRPITADPKQARHRRASEQGYRWQGRTRRAARGGAAGH